MMTKKDFIALADAIRESNRCTVSNTFSYGQLGTLAAFCGSVNPRFNPKRWLDYIEGKCGPNGGAIRKPKETTQ